MSYVKTVLSDTPVGYWPLDERSGTVAYDVSGNGRNGTYTGSITPGARQTLMGLAPDFTGGYITVSDNAVFSGAGANGLLTVECWALVDTLASFRDFMSKSGSASQYEWALMSSASGQVYWSNYNITTGGDDSAIGGAGTVATTTLVHLVGTTDRAAQLVTLYKNGVQVAQDTSSAITMSDGTAQVEIGGATVHGVIDGTVQHCAIYGTALTATRVLAHYKAGIRSGIVL